MKKKKDVNIEIVVPQPKKKTLDEMSPIEIIEQCGKLKQPIEKVVNILCLKDKSINEQDIRIKLTTPGTDEYRVYHSAGDVGQFEIDEAMYSDATSGSKTSVDSQKALKETQRERNINEVIKEKFFPDED